MKKGGIVDGALLIKLASTAAGIAKKHAAGGGVVGQ